jgi:hypothetical protein
MQKKPITAKQHGNSINIKECTRLDRVKTTTSIIKGSKLILNCIYWAQALEFQVELMLEKFRNGLVTRQTV